MATLIDLEQRIIDLETDLQGSVDTFNNFINSLTKINALEPASNLTGNELVAVKQGLKTVNTPLDDIKSFFSGVTGEIVFIGDTICFKGSGNSNKTTIQIGDNIIRFPSNKKIIIGLVNSLPHTNENNLSIILEQQCL